MKRLFIGLGLIALLILLVAGSRPIYDAFLQSNLDGNAKSITNLLNLVLTNDPDARIYGRVGTLTNGVGLGVLFTNDAVASMNGNATNLIAWWDTYLTGNVIVGAGGDIDVLTGDVNVGSQITGDSITAITGFHGPGSDITSLTAANLTPGGTLPPLNGANLTNVWKMQPYSANSGLQNQGSITYYLSPQGVGVNSTAGIRVALAHGRRGYISNMVGWASGAIPATTNVVFCVQTNVNPATPVDSLLKLTLRGDTGILATNTTTEFATLTTNVGSYFVIRFTPSSSLGSMVIGCSFEWWYQ